MSSEVPTEHRYEVVHKHESDSKLSEDFQKVKANAILKYPEFAEEINSCETMSDFADVLSRVAEELIDASKPPAPVPSGYVSLPETPKLAEGSTYADLEHMITDLTTKALKGDRVSKEKLRRLTEIAIQISTQSQKSGNISKVLGNVAFGVCPRCGKATTTDFNVPHVRCRYCGFESGTKKMFQRKIRGE